MLKRVFGRAGDVVKIDSTGVFINEQRVAESRPLKEDRSGRKLKAANLKRELGAGELILLGRAESSFDSRYFGVVSVKGVKSVIGEVLVEPSE